LAWANKAQGLAAFAESFGAVSWRKAQGKEFNKNIFKTFKFVTLLI
jgi:hypothetical protein